jgi:hypothetical protein
MFRNRKMSAPTDIRDALHLLTNDNPAEPVDQKPPRSKLVRRINLELPEKAAAQLEWLEHETGSPSSAEVIRDALKLYYGLVHEIKNGGTITISENSGEQKKLKIFL